jgi:hypothetical protein
MLKEHEAGRRLRIWRASTASHPFVAREVRLILVSKFCPHTMRRQGVERKENLRAPCACALAQRFNGLDRPRDYGIMGWTLPNCDHLT